MKVVVREEREAGRNMQGRREVSNAQEKRNEREKQLRGFWKGCKRLGTCNLEDRPILQRFEAVCPPSLRLGVSEWG